MGELQDVIGTALGGEMVTTMVQGRERFGVTVRYPREMRSDPQQTAREVLVTTRLMEWIGSARSLHRAAERSPSLARPRSRLKELVGACALPASAPIGHRLSCSPPHNASCLGGGT